MPSGALKTTLLLLFLSVLWLNVGRSASDGDAPIDLAAILKASTDGASRTLTGVELEEEATMQEFGEEMQELEAWEGAGDHSLDMEEYNSTDMVGGDGIITEQVSPTFPILFSIS